VRVVCLRSKKRGVCFVFVRVWPLARDKMYICTSGSVSQSVSQSVEKSQGKAVKMEVVVKVK
jgi:hypothetical protein